jgi:hypothetical protein
MANKMAEKGKDFDEKLLNSKNKLLEWIGKGGLGMKVAKVGIVSTAFFMAMSAIEDSEAEAGFFDFLGGEDLIDGIIEDGYLKDDFSEKIKEESEAFMEIHGGDLREKVEGRKEIIQEKIDLNAFEDYRSFDFSAEKYNDKYEVVKDLFEKDLSIAKAHPYEEITRISDLYEPEEEEEFQRWSTQHVEYTPEMVENLSITSIKYLKAHLDHYDPSDGERNPYLSILSSFINRSSNIEIIARNSDIEYQKLALEAVLSIKEKTAQLKELHASDESIVRGSLQFNFEEAVRVEASIKKMIDQQQESEKKE